MLTERYLCGNVVSLNYKMETHSFLLQQTKKSSHSIPIFFRTHNTLYAPEMLAKMAEPFTRVLDMLEVEKSAILGKKCNLFFFLEVFYTLVCLYISIPYL